MALFSSSGHSVRNEGFNDTAYRSSNPTFSGRKLRISVVIPALNEASNLPHVIPWIPEWIDEVILVDGYSTDGTANVARMLRPDIKVVLQTGRGKGAALRSGFSNSTGDIIVMLDADGSTDPSEIPAFIGALIAGADFAKGSRFLQGGGTADMPLYRKLGNWGFVVMVRLLFGGTYTDLCYGYNAFWRSVLPLINLDGDGFEIETMMNIRAIRAGLRIAEVPSFEDKRVYGTGRLRAFPDGWRVLKTIFRERFGKTSVIEFENETASGEEDHFTPAVQLIIREAIHLAQNRDRLPEPAYQMALDSIKAAFAKCLSEDVGYPEAKRLQQRYRKYYSPERFWAFLDVESAKE